jgi:hypothetical protein
VNSAIDRERAASCSLSALGLGYEIQLSLFLPKSGGPIVWEAWTWILRRNPPLPFFARNRSLIPGTLLPLKEI